MIARWCLVIGLLLEHGAVSAAQLSYAWSFDELRSKSDLVVVARPIATRDTGTKATLNDLRPPLAVVELNTEFKVLSVLKGEAVTGGILFLRHY